MSTASLDDLRDIHLPPEPPFAAIDGWLLGVMAAASLLLMLYAAYRVWHRRRYAPLHHARRQLARLARPSITPQDAPMLARELSQLLRTYAMHRYPDRPIAGLTGNAWLSFLDETGGAGEFANGVGKALASLPYRPRGTVDQAALIALVSRWLEANRP